MPELFAATEASLKAYQDRIKELEEALKPFAEIGKRIDYAHSDIWHDILVKGEDLRRAAELLRK